MLTRFRFIGWLAPACAIAIGAGCSVLKPKADVTKFYVLRLQLPPQTNALQAGAADLRIGPSRIADYLESAPIAVEEAPERIRYLANHHWAEPLPRSISRVLSEGLGRSLGEPRVTVYPDPPGENAGYEIRYSINRFEGPLNGALKLDVVWELRERPSNKLLFSAHPVYEIPAEGKASIDNYVQRHARALERWAEDMVGAIRDARR